jgi:hypothetical protein
MPKAGALSGDQGLLTNWIEIARPAARRIAAQGLRQINAELANVA